MLRLGKRGGKGLVVCEPFMAHTSANFLISIIHLFILFWCVANVKIIRRKKRKKKERTDSPRSRSNKLRKHYDQKGEPRQTEVVDAAKATTASYLISSRNILNACFSYTQTLLLSEYAESYSHFANMGRGT